MLHRPATLRSGTSGQPTLLAVRTVPRRPATARTAADQPATTTDRHRTAAGHPTLAHLPRSVGTQTRAARQTTHETQTTDADFQALAEANAPKKASYTRLDHGATQAMRQFRQDIADAGDKYGRRVAFTPVMDGSRLIGYRMSSRRALEKADPAELPALFVAGTSLVGELKSTFTPRAGVFRIDGRAAAAGAPNPTEFARALRRGAEPPAQSQTHAAGVAGMPNLRIGSGTLQPAEAARFVAGAGRSPAHATGVDVFVAAPGMNVHLSTVMRTLPPGAYRGVVYASY